MANSWSKEDRLHYEKSEVWQELEKHIINTVKRAEILQQKINEKTARWEGMDGQQAGAAEAACQMKGGCKNVDDAIVDEAVDKASDEVAEDALKEDEYDDVHDEVIDDLRALAKAAIADGNIKLAYKIERTIDEILEQEVACE